MRRDAVYDPRAQQGSLPVQVHFEDGGVSEVTLILTPDQMEVCAYQIGRIIDQRNAKREG